jgi:hypothetical protein
MAKTNPALALAVAQSDQVTGTPASNVSSADFERSEGGGDDGGEFDLLANSPMREMLGLDAVPEPGGEEDDGDDASGSADEQAGDEAGEAAEGKEGDAKEGDEADDAAGDEDTGPDTPIAEDAIDWDLRVTFKVGDKDHVVSFGELKALAGQQAVLAQRETELTAKEQAITTKEDERLAELTTIGTALQEELMLVENNLASQYVEAKKALDKAKEDGDTFLARELKDKVSDLQEKYWESRHAREAKLKKIAEKFGAREQERKKQLLQKFSADVAVMQKEGKLPTFDQDLAKSLRQFALDEGLPAEVVDSIYDARIVKVLNDYRTLKLSLDKGKQKREKAVTPKRAPLKTGTKQTAAGATKAQSQQTRQRVFSGEASSDEQMGFLKGLIKQQF